MKFKFMLTLIASAAFAFLFGGLSSTASAACTPAEQHTTAGTGLTYVELLEFVADAKSTMGLDDCELNAILDDPALIAATPTETEIDLDGIGEVEQSYTSAGLRVNCNLQHARTFYKNRIGQVLLRFTLSNEWCYNGRRVLSM
ncbi:MAG TPA: hypothetical protein VLK58_20810 [Conexibacter sp.]|nr:hypothetical protein [Conexibacter sp.]